LIHKETAAQVTEAKEGNTLHSVFSSEKQERTKDERIKEKKQKAQLQGSRRT